MYETSRHQYLNALGIDSYMPRLLLVNAPEPQECEWPDVAIDSAAPELGLAQDQAPVESGYAPAPVDDLMIPPPSKVSGADVANVVESMLADISPSSPAAKAKPKAKATADIKPIATVDSDIELAQAAPAVRFSLSLWQCGPLLILDSRDSQKALPTEKLLLSILQACGLPLGNLPRAEVLQWPMFESGDADESASAARQMLAAFLEPKLSEPKDYCLLMGLDAQYLLPEGSLSDRREPSSFGQVLPPEALELEAIAPRQRLLLLPSLVDMLEQPELKAKAWQALAQINNKA